MPSWPSERRGPLTSAVSFRLRTENWYLMAPPPPALPIPNYNQRTENGGAQYCTGWSYEWDKSLEECAAICTGRSTCNAFAHGPYDTVDCQYNPTTCYSNTNSITVGKGACGLCTGCLSTLSWTDAPVPFYYTAYMAIQQQSGC